MQHENVDNNIYPTIFQFWTNNNNKNERNIFIFQTLTNNTINFLTILITFRNSRMQKILLKMADKRYRLATGNSIQALTLSVTLKQPLHNISPKNFNFNHFPCRWSSEPGALIVYVYIYHICIRIFFLHVNGIEGGSVFKWYLILLKLFKCNQFHFWHLAFTTMKMHQLKLHIYKTYFISFRSAIGIWIVWFNLLLSWNEKEKEICHGVALQLVFLLC